MDKFFKISERGSNVRTEIIAGLTTFFAMAYIVVTNPNQIVSFNHLAPDADPAFQQIWNAVYVASILAAIIGTLLMALYAKMPFAQACGMGLNSFFFVSFILPEIISGGDVIFRTASRKQSRPVSVCSSLSSASRMSASSRLTSTRSFSSSISTAH